MLAAHGEMKKDEPGKTLVQSTALCQLLGLRKVRCSPFPGKIAQEIVPVLITG